MNEKEIEADRNQERARQRLEKGAAYIKATAHRKNNNKRNAKGKIERRRQRRKQKARATQREREMDRRSQQ